MRSLRVKFSALVVTLLVAASVGLAFIATQHERRALEAEVEKRGRALVVNLAGAAKEPKRSSCGPRCMLSGWGRTDGPYGCPRR